MFVLLCVAVTTTTALDVEARRRRRPTRRQMQQQQQKQLVEVEMRTNATRVEVGDTFQVDVIVTVRSEDPVEELVLPDFSAFRVLDDRRSRSQRIAAVNGVKSVEFVRNYTYVLLAERTGKHTISAARAKVGTQRTAAKPLRIMVDKRDPRRQRDKNGERDLYLDVKFDKKSAFVGEQVTLTVEVYATTGVDIRQLQVPELPGFWVEEMGGGRVRPTERRIGGRTFYVYPLQKLALFPLDVGTQSTGPMSVQVTTGGGLFKRGKTTVLNAPAQTLEVKPVPPAPAGVAFKGNVGFYRLRSSLSAATTPAGQAVTLKVELTGEGNPGQAQLPDVAAALQKVDGLRVFPPSTSDRKSVERGHLYGAKQVELLVQPLDEGVFEIPAFEVAFFNPHNQQFEKARSRPLRLRATPRSTSASTSTNSARRQQVIEGARPLHIRVPLDGKPRPLWQWGAVAGIPMVLLALLSFALLRRRQDHAASAAGRWAQARKDILQRVDEAEQQQKLQDVQDLLLQTLADHVADDAKSIPLPTLRERLRKAGLPPKLADDATEWLEQVDAVRYAGETGDRRSLFKAGRGLIETLFDHVKQGSRA